MKGRALIALAVLGLTGCGGATTEAQKDREARGREVHERAERERRTDHTIKEALREQRRLERE